MIFQKMLMMHLRTFCCGRSWHAGHAWHSTAPHAHVHTQVLPLHAGNLNLLADLPLPSPHLLAASLGLLPPSASIPPRPCHTQIFCENSWGANQPIFDVTAENYDSHVIIEDLQITHQRKGEKEYYPFKIQKRFEQARLHRAAYAAADINSKVLALKSVRGKRQGMLNELETSTSRMSVYM